MKNKEFLQKPDIGIDYAFFSFRNDLTKEKAMTNVEICKGNEALTLVRPEITVYETEKELILEAEIPGVPKDKVEVRLEGDHLILGGRREWNFPENAQVLYQETFPVEYYRDLTLGKDINRDSIQAVYESGILKVRLQRTEAAKPKQIKVEVK